MASAIAINRNEASYPWYYLSFRQHAASFLSLNTVHAERELMTTLAVAVAAAVVDADAEP